MRWKNRKFGLPEYYAQKDNMFENDCWKECQKNPDYVPDGVEEKAVKKSWKAAARLTKQAWKEGVRMERKEIRNLSASPQRRKLKVRVHVNVAA